MDGMQKDLAGRPDRQGRRDPQGAFPLASQQFLLASQLHSALGVLLYSKKDFDEALPHLERAFFRDWQAQATLGALHYKRNEYAEMEKAFEKAVSRARTKRWPGASTPGASTRPASGTKAQQVLTRAIEANPSDERLKSNLIALQNDKRMKMQAYEPEWFQFHLERLPPSSPAGGAFSGSDGGSEDAQGTSGRTKSSPRRKSSRPWRGTCTFRQVALKKEFFKPSDTHSTCPWKGVASYLRRGRRRPGEQGRRVDLPHALPAAANIKDHVAFWHGVTVEK